MNYYNENDPKAVAWLRQLIADGLIPKGTVDERSITEVTSNDLSGFTQCHFFAGIGGWSYALQLAQWPVDRPIWTGSCPCQPFSLAGAHGGTGDERHLWPEMFRLAKQCRPSTIIGEQVEAAVGHGWLDGVFTDLEGEEYACGAAVLGAHSVGAPHIRQRLYWVGHSSNQRWNIGGDGEDATKRGAGSIGAASAWGACGMEYAEGNGREQRWTKSSGRGSVCGCIARGVGNSYEQGREGESLRLMGAGHQGNWSDFDILPCRDGKARRVESGTFPLAHGVPGRVGLLRGYGNAIVPQVAAEFIQAVLESIE